MKKVVMYTLSTCPWCRKTKQFFKDRGILFEYVDYDLAEDEQQENIMMDMAKYSVNTSFPFVKIGRNVVIGYDPERYAELLGLRE